MHIPTSLAVLDEATDEDSSETINLAAIGATLESATLQGQPLLESSLIQWMVTRCRHSSLTSSEAVEDPNLFSRLMLTAPGTILALQPPGRIKNVTRRASATVRKKFLEHQMKWPDLGLSHSAFLICLDSHTQGLHSHLYPNAAEAELCDWDYFRLTIGRLLDAVTDGPTRGRIEDRLSVLSTILYELFKNTHDHARTGYAGEVVDDSIRGIYSRYYRREHLEMISAGSTERNRANEYVLDVMGSAISTARGATRNKYQGVLELTVFDAGPGLASKWLGRDASDESGETQLNAVMQCFQKGATSTSSASRGFGLWKVLLELNRLNGFIRIRTNRINAYRQFLSQRVVGMSSEYPGVETPIEKLFDWRRGLTERQSKYSAVEGASISVLIPMGAP